jgi:agmatinase
LLGAPYDGTSGGRPVQARAPGLIRQALARRDLDGVHVWDIGDARAAPVDFSTTDDRLQTAIHQAREASNALLALLGGEHTVSLSAVRALKPASVVSLDAHPDLWDTQHGRKIAQATWLRRAIDELGCEVVLPTARAARGAEADTIDEHGIPTTVPDRLPEPVYLTVDVDVFDPEDAPGVVWPEPDGPDVDEVLDLVERVAREHRLAGVDVVETNERTLGPTTRLAARVLERAVRAA